MPIRRILFSSHLLLAFTAAAITTGCSTAPEAKERAAFRAAVDKAETWFEENVDGLGEQIEASAAHIIFPEVMQWGTGFGGGRWGRGMVRGPQGDQIGWSAVNTTSLGLQAGVQGFKMLIVIEDAATLEAFQQDRLAGSISSVVVVLEGESETAPFENGIAIYQGANVGLMAGVNVALDLLRYEPLEEDDG